VGVGEDVIMWGFGDLNYKPEIKVIPKIPN
jgi:hypothetical protein